VRLSKFAINTFRKFLYPTTHRIELGFSIIFLLHFSTQNSNSAFLCATVRKVFFSFFLLLRAISFQIVNVWNYCHTIRILLNLFSSKFVQLYGCSAFGLTFYNGIVTRPKVGEN